MKPRNRFLEIDSTSLCSLAGRYDVAWRAGTTNRVVVPTRQAGNRFLGSLKGLKSKYRVPQGMSPRRNWDSPTPSRSEGASPPNQRGGTVACRRGVGEPQFRRLEKKFSTLPTLWARLLKWAVKMVTNVVF
jgi:hypothetical protein